MYTMNRCNAHLPDRSSSRSNAIKNIAARAINTWTKGLFCTFLVLLSLIGSPAHAQQESGVVLSAPETGIVDLNKGRSFPPNALRGTLEVVQGAEVIMDGQAARMSPGARIRGPNNMLVMSGAMAGQRYVVNFTRDTFGNIHQVWVLTELEAQQKIKTATPERNFVFGSEGDKPKVDDGKTPFNQLPKFKQ
jgi:hypothetical protein